MRQTGKREAARTFGRAKGELGGKQKPGRNTLHLWSPPGVEGVSGPLEGPWVVPHSLCFLEGPWLLFKVAACCPLSEAGALGGCVQEAPWAATWDSEW